jgi:hypothetical protein
MKQVTTKNIYATQGVVSNFTVPATRNGGLNQGALIAEIFAATGAAIKDVVRYNNYESAVTTSSQVLFFKNVLPGDRIRMITKTVRRMKDIKITVALQKMTGLNADVIATGKFLYTVN